MLHTIAYLSRQAPRGIAARVTRRPGALLLRLAVVGVLLSLLLGPAPARSAEAAVFVVRTASDRNDVNPGDGICRTSAGTCSLRAAIQEANATPGLDTITFRRGTGVFTISPFRPLPDITDPVVIDGTTQPGFAGTPIVELNGALAGPSASGLFITGGRSIVRGLVINRFSGHGITIRGPGLNVIRGNFIGTDVSGRQPLGNGLAGVFMLDSSNNLIGLSDDGNVISGNAQQGVRIFGGQAASGNQLVGNYIGISSG